MKRTPFHLPLPTWLLLCLLTACSPAGNSLQPGVATLPQVVEQMGKPSMIWSDEHGNLMVEFSRLPGQQQNFMARFSQDGVLISLELVLTESRVVNLREGMSREDVRRLIGRPGSIEQADLAHGERWHWPLDSKKPADWQISVEFDMRGEVRSVERTRIRKDTPPRTTLADKQHPAPL